MFLIPHNRELININLPKVEKIGNIFLRVNLKLTSIDLPKVKKIGINFIANNIKLETINIPKVSEIGINFLYSNKKVRGKILSEKLIIKHHNLSNIENLFQTPHICLTKLLDNQGNNEYIKINLPKNFLSISSWI